jgi:hypothetical protein
VSRFSLKRYTQRQLTEIFCTQASIPYHSDYQKRWWINPLDSNSLRLTLAGLQFVKANLKLTSYEFKLPIEITNQNLLRLERLFQGPYYLLKRQKIIIFEEQEAVMLTLMCNDINQYLENLEINRENPET